MEEMHVTGFLLSLLLVSASGLGVGDVCKSTSDGSTFEVNLESECPPHYACTSLRSPFAMVVGGPETFTCQEDPADPPVAGGVSAFGVNPATEGTDPAAPAALGGPAHATEILMFAVHP